MKAFLHYGLIILFSILINYNLPGQNPNWAMPPYSFSTSYEWFASLPSSGAEPYDGQPATNLSASYSDDNGNLILFTVDEKVYDKNGNLAGEMHADGSIKKGHSQRLILPMGNDCKRYAIIYSAAESGSGEKYSSKVFGRRLYMAIYNLESVNIDYPGAIGALEKFSTSTLLDISMRDAMIHGPDYSNPNDPAFNNPAIYGIYDSTQTAMGNYQIAATELVDNCFFFVYVFDGKYIIRYKLTNSDLEFDDYVWKVPNAQTGSLMRTEMELINLQDGNYRIAIPIKAQSSDYGGSIAIVDIDGISKEIIPNSLHIINFGISTIMEPYGLEFNSSGQYLFFTHKEDPNYPNALDVYDVENQSYVSLPVLPEIEEFRESYIERLGDVMYLVSDNAIGRLSNINNPSNLLFDPTFLLIPGGYYKSDLNGQGSPGFDSRYMLPTQIDMPYPSLSEMSCDCCAKFATAHGVVEVDVNSTWSPAYNPFGIGVNHVYIDEELRIRAGTSLQIENMNFHFGPDARVVVERGNGTISGAHLTLTNNTVFTADFRCNNSGSNPCGDFEGCEKQLWQGIRVEGHKSDLSQSTAFQGKLTMSNGAKIEYAHTGVRVGHETKSNYGGGIVNISKSVFKDNIVGIEFKSYTHKTAGVEKFNKSIIKQNTFQTTQDWFVDLNPSAHVLVWNSSGLSLKGNLFENINTSLTGSDRGLGVKSYDSRVIVEYDCTSAINPCPSEQQLVRSEFKNLYFGIYGANTLGTIYTLQSNYNIFDNNEIGIYLSNHLSPKILDNDFYLHQNSASTKGVVLVASTGYMVENNKFEGLNPVASKQGVGVWVNNSGPQPNEIYRNDFSKLYIGGLVEGLNGDNSCCDVGLQWLCNDFSEIRHSDIALLENGTMATSQGISCSSPAGNLFSHSSAGASPGHFDLYSENPGLEINYRHHNNTGFYPRLIPLRYTNQGYAPHYFTFTACSNSYSKYKCKVKNSGKPRLDDGSGPIVNKDSSFDDYWTQANSFQLQSAALQSASNEEVAEFNANEYYFWNNVVTTYQWDTTGVICAMQLNNLLTAFEPKVIDRFAIAVLGSSATSWSSTHAQAIPNYTTLPELTENGLPIDIPSYFESDFFGNLGNVHALNSLYKANNAFHSPYVVLPNIYSDKSIGGAKSLNPDDENAEQQSQINAVPNPFKESVSFDFSEYSFTGDNNVIEFYDVVGKKIYSLQISKNEKEVTISGNKLPEGVILFRFYTDGKLVETGKLIKVK